MNPPRSKYLDDFINPIVVKELRQAVKGKFVTWVLIGYLILQMVLLGIFLILRENRLDDRIYLGQEVFVSLGSILIFTCMLFLPAFTGIRMANERSEQNVDLFFVTALSPWRIIWGKLLAGTILTLLIFSACLPFMTLTYLLRGIDLPSIFVILGFYFLCVLIAISCVLTLACIPGGAMGRGFRFLLALFGLLFFTWMLIMITPEMVDEGIGSMMRTRDFLIAAATFVGLVSLLIGFLFVLSVTLITPASANKALMPRLYATLTWAVTGGYFYYLDRQAGLDGIFAYVWGIGATAGICVFFLFTICERQQIGLRVRRLIPRNRLLRAFAFLFYSGAGGGILWCGLLMFLTILALNLVGFTSVLSRIVRIQQELVTVLTCIFLYIIAYGLTALTVRRLFFPPHISAKTTAIIALTLLVVGSVIPMLVGFLLTQTDMDMLNSHWYIFNPLVVTWEESIRPASLFLTSVWCLIVIIANAPWFVQQVRQFKPLPKMERSSVEEAA